MTRLPVAALRAAMEREMADTLVVERYDGPGTVDLDTGLDAGDTWTPVYTGAGAVYEQADNAPTAADGYTTLLRQVVFVRVPFNANVAVGDRVRVTVSANGDPAILDQVLRVVKVPTGSFSASKRLLCDHWDNEGHMPRESVG